MLAAAAFTLLWHLHHRQLPPCQQQQHSSLVKQKTFFSTVKKAGWLTHWLALCFVLARVWQMCSMSMPTAAAATALYFYPSPYSTHTAQHLKDTDCEAGEKERFIVAQLRFKRTCSTVRIRSFFAFLLSVYPVHSTATTIASVLQQCSSLFSFAAFYFSPAPEKAAVYQD